MTADWYPGAHTVELGGTGRITVSRPDNVLHIAASSWNIPEDDPTSLVGITGWIETDYTEAHGYNDMFGNFIQYTSVWNQVAGTYQGNYRNRTWEAWNPPESEGDLNLSGYTDAQCERFSDLLAWDSIVNGTLLDDMLNSKSGSHGVGCHRYGITAYNPWKTAGGEIWSLSSSKLCPGTVRVQQVPGIVARAKVIKAAVLAGQCSYLPKGRVNLKQALARTGNTANNNDWIDDLMASVTDEEKQLLLNGARASVHIDANLQELMNRTFVLVDQSEKQLTTDRFNEVATDVVNRLFIIQDHIDSPNSITPKS